MCSAGLLREFGVGDRFLASSYVTHRHEVLCITCHVTTLRRLLCSDLLCLLCSNLPTWQVSEIKADRSFVKVSKAFNKQARGGRQGLAGLWGLLACSSQASGL